jgi:ferredoxin
MDAIVGMDGNGPNGGDPFPMNVIVAGTDPIAVDSTMCRIVGIDPRTVPMLRIGEACGLGTTQENAITVVGAALDDVRTDGFRALTPQSEVGRLLPLPRFLSSVFQRWIVRRPRIIHHACTRCKTCVKVCPAQPKALAFKNGKVLVNDSSCILCYCCHEMCPSRAIALKRGFAASLLTRMLRID